MCTPAQLPCSPQGPASLAVPKAMNKLLSGGQVERRHFATDLFPCELMKRYTQFQKKKIIFYRPIILLSQYNATVEDLVSVNRRSNSDHQLSQISCTNTIATGLMPLPHKLTVPVQIIIYLQCFFMCKNHENSIYRRRAPSLYLCGGCKVPPQGCLIYLVKVSGPDSTRKS